MQIFIHDVTVSGGFRGPDADMQQGAVSMKLALDGVTGRAFAGVRLFVERSDGVDQGLIVVEGASFNGVEFPTPTEMGQLEADVRSAALADPGVQSVGKIRFHSLTALAV